MYAYCIHVIYSTYIYIYRFGTKSFDQFLMHFNLGSKNTAFDIIIPQNKNWDPRRLWHHSYAPVTQRFPSSSHGGAEVIERSSCRTLRRRRCGATHILRRPTWKTKILMFGSFRNKYTLCKSFHPAMSSFWKKSPTKQTCGRAVHLEGVTVYSNLGQAILDGRQMMGEDLYDLSPEVPLHSMGSIIEAVYNDDEVPTSGSSVMIIQVFTAGYERTLMPKWNLIHHERRMIYTVFHPFKQLYWYLCVTL